MSLTSPTDIYFKCRRFTILMSGLLLLSVFVGIKPAEGEKGMLFGLNLNNPEILPVIFVIIVLYALWQLYVSWVVQDEPVRKFKINSIDFSISFFIGIASIFCYFWHQYGHQIYIDITKIKKGNQSWKIIITLVGMMVPILISTFAFYSASVLSKKIKKKTEQKNEYLFYILTKHKWVIIFNPKSTDGNKYIDFLEDGSIGEGRNDNETTWRIREGFLEILNSEKKIFSRFQFNEEIKEFEHTNDSDTLSIQSQRIIPITAF